MHRRGDEADEPRQGGSRWNGVKVYADDGVSVEQGEPLFAVVPTNAVRIRRSSGCSSPTAARSPCASSGRAGTKASARWSPSATPIGIAGRPAGRRRSCRSGRRAQRRATSASARSCAPALIARCDAVHPGYGFLSERPELAEACAANGLVFVGPPADVIRRGGDKVAARDCRAPRRRAGRRPVRTRSQSVDAATAVADQVGYPVLLKAAAGGGGRGMVARRRSRASSPSGSRVASSEASGGVRGRPAVRRTLRRAGATCRGADARRPSRQRRPPRRPRLLGPTALPEGRRGGPGAGVARRTARDRLADAAVGARPRARATSARARSSSSSTSIATSSRSSRSTPGSRSSIRSPRWSPGSTSSASNSASPPGRRCRSPRTTSSIGGHAIECRINAESVMAGFVPTPGVVTRWRPPAGAGIRLDTHVFAGYEVPPHYDSLLAKLIVHRRRPRRRDRAPREALADFDVGGRRHDDRAASTHRRAHRLPSRTVDTKWLENVLLRDLEATSSTDTKGVR